VAKVNKESLMSVYVGLLGGMVPRFVLYAAFSTALIVTYYLLAKPPVEFIVVAAVPTAMLRVEGLRLMRLAKRLISKHQR